jgi:hypothetical protein
MRIFIVCLCIALIRVSSSDAKDNGGSAAAPSFRDQLKDYKYEVPAGKNKKLEFPESNDPPYSGDSSDDGLRKIGKWWFSSLGDRCQLEQVAEGWQSFFLAFEPHVHYTVDTKNTDLLSIYVPSQPHPKGIPVAVVDSRIFALAPQTAKTFVPHSPQMQQAILQAMRSGKTMTVNWVNSDGARQEDRYPLTGFSDAYAELARRCP